MRLSRFRPRFTVKRLMVTVAIMGVFLGLIIKSSEWSEHRRHRFSITRDEFTLDYELAEQQSRHPDIAKRMDPRLVAYYDFMKGKYEAAARHPWLPLWPDPPKPE